MMNKEEFLEYTADPETASRIESFIDVGSIYIDFDKMLKDLDKTCPKDAEAIRFMEENKVPKNFLGYRHLKI